MNKKDVIDLGEYILKKNQYLGWDFYRKDEENGHQQCTYGSFHYVEVRGKIVFVSKTINGNIAKGIYDVTGKPKIELTQNFIDCKSTFLVKPDGSEEKNTGWDFYTKEGERITHKEFDMVSAVGKLVIVKKRRTLELLECGVYNIEGKEILPIQWKEILLYKKIAKEPGKLELLGTMDNECLKVTDSSDNEGLYEFSNEEIKEIVSCSDNYKIYIDDINTLRTGFRMQKGDNLYYYSFKTKRIIDIT